MGNARFQNLQSASFRNVPFHVEGSDIGAGRRVQVHEYPQRDKPYVEDLGRATREIRIAGFVVGDDYISQASQLLDAIEQPGGGLLVHPWHGQMRVTLKELGRVRYDRSLGFASIEMVFVEAGELEFPVAKDATANISASAADDLGSSAVTDFAGKFKVAGKLDFVNAAAQGDIQRIFQISGTTSIPGMAALNFTGQVLAATASAISVINNPTLLGQNILQAFSVQSLLEQGRQVRDLLNGSVSASSAYAEPSSSYLATTPAAAQQYANTVALYDLSRRALLVQAVGLSSVLPADVHDDVIAARNLLVSALDDEMAIAAGASDDVYDALAAARAAVFNDLTARARNGARIDIYTPPCVMPVLAIAEEYYGDAAYADEIVLRNRIRNPLLVPPQPLKMRVA